MHHIVCTHFFCNFELRAMTPCSIVTEWSLLFSSSVYVSVNFIILDKMTTVSKHGWSVSCYVPKYGPNINTWFEDKLRTVYVLMLKINGIIHLKIKDTHVFLSFYFILLSDIYVLVSIEKLNLTCSIFGWLCAVFDGICHTCDMYVPCHVWSDRAISLLQILFETWNLLWE